MMLDRSRSAGSCLAALILCGSASGCVAMNIPSQRLHDNGDQGGLLGAWHKQSRHSGSQQNESPHHSSPFGPAEHDSSASCFADEALGESFDVDFDDEFLAESPKEPDPVPWPRYHPIPTRPAFSPAPIDGHGPY